MITSSELSNIKQQKKKKQIKTTHISISDIGKNTISYIPNIYIKCLMPGAKYSTNQDMLIFN